MENNNFESDENKRILKLEKKVELLFILLKLQDDTIKALTEQLFQ